MVERIPGQYRGVRTIFYDQTFVLKLQNDAGRWAIVQPGVPMGEGPFRAGFVLKGVRQNLNFLYLIADQGVAYVSVWRQEQEGPIPFYSWLFSFLGDRCPSNSS